MVSRANKNIKPRTIRLKSCPKCKGDVVIDNDHYGWYEQCIQCGHVTDLPDCIPDSEELYIPARYEREKQK
jgi:hypothetical protein